MKVGALVPTDTPAGKDPQDQSVTLQLKLQLPNEADDNNETTIGITQTREETRQISRQ